MLKKMIEVTSMLMLFLSILVIHTIRADADQLRFTVQPDIPSNQVDMDSPWYDLLLDPGESQTLTMLITNLSDEEIVVIPEIAQATTTPFGSVDYAPNDILLDASVLHDVTELLSVPDYVAVPALGNTRLEIELQMPADHFDGMLAAGITLSEQVVERIIDDENQAGESQAGMTLENRFRLSVAILLRNSLTGIAPELGLVGAGAGHLNFRNVVNAYIRNPQPRFLSNVEIHAEVTDRNTGAILFQGAVEEPGAQFAPSSMMQFPVPLNGMPFEAGQYTMRVRAVSPDEEWDLSYDFEITAEEAARLNAEDVTLELNDFPWRMVLIGLAIFLLVLVIFLAVLLKRERAAMYDEDEDEDEYEDD